MQLLYDKVNIFIDDGEPYTRSTFTSKTMKNMSPTNDVQSSIQIVIMGALKN